MIAFIHGPDALLVRQQLNDMLRRLDPDGANTSRVDGRTTTPQTIAGMVATPSFFGMARVVVVDDLFARAGKNGESVGGDVEPANSKRATTDAIELLTKVVDPNALILVEPTLSSVPAAVKKAGAGIEVRPGVAPRGRELVKWVEQQAALIGTSFENQGQGSAIVELLEAMAPGGWREANRNPAYDVPPDLDAIQQEITKLATYCHPGPITPASIRTMTASNTADQLFPLLASIYRGNMPESVRLLADAIDQGEDHFRLIAQIYGQAELSPPIEAAFGQNPEEIGRAIGLPNPKRMAAIASSIRSRQVSPRIASVTAVDRGQKRGEIRTADDVLFALLDVIAQR